VKIWTPEVAEDNAMQEAAKQVRSAARVKLSRCACGCGKAARWPSTTDAVFHTRLCGYLMALKIMREKAAAAVPTR
jgi:hypothetical protein